jgi:predicted metal-binding protein
MTERAFNLFYCRDCQFKWRENVETEETSCKKCGSFYIEKEIEETE